MKNTIAVLLSILLLALPVGAMAASTDEHGGHGAQPVDQGDKDMQHGGMAMGGNMIMLGETTEDGVQGMAHLSDVGEAMAKMGMKENYHFMVMFNDSTTGEEISEGTVAVKVTDPAGKESAPVAMMAMEGQFGADLALTEKGEYRLAVGTKLADGKKRQFEFKHTVE
jgi:hypothetical protein